MSLNKVGSVNDKYKRQSFSIRISDELSKELLKFLQIKDKFKLESVSKQFQRTIFVKQLDFKFVFKLKHSDFVMKCCGCFITNGINLISMESTLKKCPNIERITFQTNTYIDDYDNDYIDSSFDQITDLIIKYCPHLNLIATDHFIDDLIDGKSGDKFVQKFGSNVSIELYYNPLQSTEYKKYWRPSVFAHFKTVYIKRPVYFQEGSLVNVKEFNIRFDEYWFNLNNLKSNRETLTHLSVHSGSDTIRQFSMVLNEIPNLTNLVHLEVGFPGKMSHYLIIEGLDAIGVKCVQIKSISYYVLI